MQLQRACSAAGILEAGASAYCSGALQQAIVNLALVRGGSTTTICLRCGKPGATKRCDGCSVARFCGPECERAAHASHKGATFLADPTPWAAGTWA